MTRWWSAVWVAGLMAACGGTGSGASGPDPAAGPSPASACETCLASGGTWQPEADECTAGCAIQDISCFTDECPGACGPGACGDCFGREACEAAGCVFRIEGEAAWCTGD